MKENILTIRINRPIECIFEFTTNPKNTHLWIDSILKEESDNYPPNIGDEYRNVNQDEVWDRYEVIEFVQPERFTLSHKDSTYIVTYTYKKIEDQITELTYSEKVSEDEIVNPFKQEVLEKLKLIIETL